jgi:hypothetical protein
MLRQCACERFFVIPKEKIFPLLRIALDKLCSLPALKRTGVLIRRRFLLSQFVHFRVTWEMGRPFGWSQHLLSANRSCGLLEQLDSVVEFDLIKNKNLGR